MDSKVACPQGSTPSVYSWLPCTFSDHSLPTQSFCH